LKLLSILLLEAVSIQYPKLSLIIPDQHGKNFMVFTIHDSKLGRNCVLSNWPIISMVFSLALSAIDWAYCLKEYKVVEFVLLSLPFPSSFVWWYSVSICSKNSK